MKKIITIVGARPQFVKAAMLSRAIADWNERCGESFEERVVHTGQHYDANMSAVFFEEMKIPHPTWRLHCGGKSHGAMTGEMLIQIERIISDERPDWVLVYGDTNSTLAGALAASKLHIPVVHVEAGLRSFNRAMPEEQNRVLTDHLSTVLACPTLASVQNLARENILQGVHWVGDIMFDAALFFGEKARNSSTILRDLKLKSKSFILCTFHREENTDHAGRLTGICEALEALADDFQPVVFPLHPRTRRALSESGWLPKLEANPAVVLLEPLGFLDMALLEMKASLILTDSGGVQKEAYFHRTPCVTLREETEWTETVASGWNQLAGTDPARILACARTMPPLRPINEYGDGHAAQKILQLL